MTEPMTDERLEEIEAREAAASEGPWEAIGLVVANEWPAKDVAEVLSNQNDADFIAHARLDIPDLLAEVRRLRERNALLEAVATAARVMVHAHNPIQFDAAETSTRAALDAAEEKK